MNFSYEKFLKPLVAGEKTIRIYDNSEVLRYILNPFVVKTVYLKNNIVYVSLESSQTILEFSTGNEAVLAAKKLQDYIDTIKNTNVPSWIQQAVELEAQFYTKGPTGSIGLTGPDGPQGVQGNTGLSAYQVWLQYNVGTQQDYLNSLIGPIGPTGPLAFGDTDELLVSGQTIYATVDNKDIEIITKGSGNLLFKIDRDGWLQNYGPKNNTTDEIWNSGVTIDTDGNIYTTGGDYTSFYTFVTKSEPNGNIIWQRQIDRYSQGESIVYKNDHLYVLMSDQSDPDSFGNIAIAKLHKDGYIKKLWVIDYTTSIDAPLYNIPYGSDIAVDEDDNVYYVGIQKNFGNYYDLIFGKINTTTNTVEWNKFVDGGVGFTDRGFQCEYKEGYIYVVGSVINLGNSTNPRGDVFVSKYDKSGNKIWARLIGNDNTYQEGLSIAIDDNSNVYIGGYINFDPIPGNPPTGPYNNFITKLDFSGNQIWTKSVDSFNRGIVAVIVNSVGSIFAISTQSTSSTPPRPSTDLVIFKLTPSGDIVWQQYVGTQFRDSVWANIPTMFASGHKVITSSSDNKNIYIAGLTKEGDTPVHNAFLMSFDQLSLPVSTYGNWSIQNASFNMTNSDFAYSLETYNVSGVTIQNTLLDLTAHSIITVSGHTFSSINKFSEVTLFSPNTELFVKGIINIDDNYILPRKAGQVGQVLTYKEGTDVLEWRNQTLNISFNDYETMEYSIIGSASMGIYVDPIHGTVSGNFDDAFFTINLPFVVSFMGNTYSTAYVGSNSFITFGAGYSAFAGYTEKNPPLPGIFIEAGDRSIQKLYTKTSGDQFTIRYEGATSSTGPSVPGQSEIIWEVNLFPNGKMITSIERNYVYGKGFSFLKTSDTITREIETATASSFWINKGYGVNSTIASRLNYNNIKGLSYSIEADPLFPGQSLVSLEFDNNSSSSSFTTFGSTGSLITINNDSDYTFHSGIEKGKDQFLKTKELFPGSQGLFVQVTIPIMIDDTDRIKLGFKNSVGAWSAHVELTYNTLTDGNMIIYNTTGGVVTYTQIYQEGDVLSIYSDTQTVFYSINGVTLHTCPFSNTSLAYRFVSETVVQPGPIPTNVVSTKYSSGTLNNPILDNTDGLPIYSGGTVSVPLVSSPTDIFVEINLTHTYLGDLLINLVSPSGQIINLYNLQNGGSDNMTNTVFTSKNTYPNINGASSPHTGTFYWNAGIGLGDAPNVSTVSNLTDLLAGLPTTGDWHLVIEDYYGGDTGNLINFSIFFEYNDYLGILSRDYNFSEFRLYPTGSIGTGFNSISNYSNNRILTSDGTSNTANAESNITFDGSSLTVNGNTNLQGHTLLQQTSEVVTTSFGATAADVIYDFTTGSVWYHGTASNDYTANFVNMPITNNRAITTNILISQGNNAYAPNVVKVDGTTQTVKWANGTYSVTPNGVDIVGFTFLRSEGVWTQVLGQISSFE